MICDGDNKVLVNTITVHEIEKRSGDRNGDKSDIGINRKLYVGCRNRYIDRKYVEKGIGQELRIEIDRDRRKHRNTDRKRMQIETELVVKAWKWLWK